MTDYCTLPLKAFVDLARESSDELGSLGGGLLTNYENGRLLKVVDEPTALFLASARGIVLELARRVIELERECEEREIPY